MSAVLDPTVSAKIAALADAQSLAFLTRGNTRRSVPFTLTPCPVSAQAFAQLRAAAPLLGLLTQRIADDADLVQRVHAPLASADAFFAELLATHERLHSRAGQLARVPLLLQRSDFMIDAEAGARLVECNSIAAGMAPFGEQVAGLHAKLAVGFPQLFTQYLSELPGALLPNEAGNAMAAAMAQAAAAIARDIDDDGPLRVLMVVQENEDNVFDQALLADALQRHGVQTHRRTLRELHSQLAGGRNDALVLADVGIVHVVYLRAGYDFLDYVAQDLDTQRCCDALQDTRVFIERHRVALNATVAQQLATSKRMQLQLAADNGALLRQLDFEPAAVERLRSVFAPMQEVTAHSAAMLREAGEAQRWVLKNQGEGGGHCLFGDDIPARLAQMHERDYGAWTLMQRLRPAGRDTPTLLFRHDGFEQVSDLTSEIGLFTAHLAQQALHDNGDLPGYLGYLVRSKPPGVAEGGIHSGSGALDSLYLLD